MSGFWLFGKIESEKQKKEICYLKSRVQAINVQLLSKKKQAMLPLDLAYQKKFKNQIEVRNINMRKTRKQRDPVFKIEEDLSKESIWKEACTTIYVISISSAISLTHHYYNNQQIIKVMSSQPNSKEPLNVEQNKYDLSTAAHPLACIFTFAFKLSAFVSYFFVGYFLPDVITFIIVVLFGALDFWVVKNITGRLLVGLRWWTDFDQEGKQTWKYESYDKEYITNKVDVAFFWTSQISGTIVWVVFLLLTILSLRAFWGLLVFINFCLCGMNLYGYYKCRQEYSKKLKDLKAEVAKEGIAHFVGKAF